MSKKITMYDSDLSHEKRKRAGSFSLDAGPNYKTLESLDFIGAGKGKMTNKSDGESLKKRENQHKPEATHCKATYFDFCYRECLSNTGARAAEKKTKITSLSMAGRFRKGATHPSLNARSSRCPRMPAFFRSIHRWGLNISASGPHTPRSVWTTLSGMARVVPLGTTMCISDVPGSGSERGIVIVSEACTWTDGVRPLVCVCVLLGAAYLVMVLENCRV